MTGPFDMTDTGDAGHGCARFDELLPDYLEGSLSPAALVNADAHLAACERCSALVADLGDLRTTAAALPVLAPSRDLWDGIAARIAAPVIPIEVRETGARGVVKRRVHGWSPAWLGDAAAGLVAVTAGVTHQLTLRSNAAPAVAVDTTRPAAPAGPSAVAARPEGTGAPDSAAPKAAPGPQRPPRAGANVRTVRRATAEQTYDREIASLGAILENRRESLNPATVAVLELNLKIIDNAIAQSRAALAKDPASDFLDRQLDKALEKKLELLRTAALLPAT
jgi:anti-sigma factor RsiW